MVDRAPNWKLPSPTLRRPFVTDIRCIHRGHLCRSYYFVTRHRFEQTLSCLGKIVRSGTHSRSHILLPNHLQSVEVNKALDEKAAKGRIPNRRSSSEIGFVRFCGYWSRYFLRSWDFDLKQLRIVIVFHV